MKEGNRELWNMGQVLRKIGGEFVDGTAQVADTGEMRRNLVKEFW